MSWKPFRNLLLVPLFLMLGGCNLVVLHPAGQVAVGERDLLVASTLLMCLIIVPVMILVAVIAYRYRQSNRQANYDPDWEHSIQLELIIWAAPLLIIIALGALTWIGTHKLDPYRPIDSASAAGTASKPADPMTIKVVSLDWQWLFLYPKYHIATVNQIAAPVGVPIRFRLTSQTVMDSFFVPALAGQIYTMAGMETRLHAVINKVGSFRGFSANISGDGFTDMRFRFLGMSGADFKKWVQKVKSSGGDLNPTTYAELAKPTRNGPVKYYAKYSPKLYEAIVHRCIPHLDTSCTNPRLAAAMGGEPTHGTMAHAAADSSPRTAAAN